MKTLINSTVFFFIVCGTACGWIFTSTQAGKETNYVILEEVILVQGGVVNEDGGELAIDYNTYAHKGTSYADADFTFECNGGEGWDTIALTYASGDDSKQWVFDTASTVKEEWICRLSFDGSADSVERTDNNDIELAAFDDDDVTNRSTQGSDDIAPQLMSITILSSGEAIEAIYNELVVIGDGGTVALTMSAAGDVSPIYSNGSGTDTLTYACSTIERTETASDGWDYTNPGGGGIQDTSGNEAGAEDNFTVINNSGEGTTPIDPELESATIGTTGKILTLGYSESVDIGAGGSGGVSLTMTVAGELTLTYSSGSGSATLVYTITQTVYPGDTAFDGLDYINPGNGWEATDDNTDVGNLNNFSIINNSAAVKNIVIAGYATELGSGSKNGTSWANAWSRSQINDPSICDTDLDADDQKIGSGEHVYLGNLSGDITNICSGSAVNGQTVYDFYEDGDRARASNEAVGATFNGTIYFKDADYVCVQDGRFDNPSYSVAYNSIMMSWENLEKNSHVTIQRCYFKMDHNENNAIYAGFTPYLKILDNYYDSYTGDCWSSGYGGGNPKFISCNNGVNITIKGNYITGGQEGLFMGLQINRHGAEQTYAQKDIPSNSLYTIDNEAHFNNFEVCHNVVTWRCFEGFSLDHNDAWNAFGVVDTDVVAEINVDGNPNKIKLTNSGWNTVGDRWSGMYAGNICSRSSDCNKWVLITDQSNKDLTLNDASHIQVGDYLSIALVAKNIFWHHNKIDAYGFGQSSYLWEDSVYQSLFENNSSDPKDWEAEGPGITFQSHTAIGDSGWGGPFSHCMSVTGNHLKTFCSQNVAQNNLLGDVVANLYDQWSTGETYTIQKAVAVINNDFHTTYYTRGEHYNYANYYSSGNTNVHAIAGTGSSAVTDTWSSSVISTIRGIFPPSITNVTVTPGLNYFDVTFGEVATGNAACVAGGDCGIGITNGTSSISGIEYDTVVGGSGTTTWRFKYTGSDPSSGYQLTYDGDGDIVDGDSKEMHVFGYPMGHRIYDY